jgi:type I restriction enzyme, S subunit
LNVSLAPIGDLVEPVRTWNPAATPDTTFNYVDLSAIDQIEKQIKFTVPVRGAEAPSRARQLISKGDILVSTVRPNLNGVAPVIDSFDGATASTGFCVLRPRSEKLSSNYLLHWVRSPQFINHMVREATGASYPAVSDRIIKASHIPLPPLDEQRRIAAILDKADALRRKRKRVLDLFGTLTDTLIAELLDAPQSTDLDEIIAEGPTNGLYKPLKDYGEGVPILRINNFYDGKIVDLPSLRRLSVTDSELSRFKLTNDDIVINRVNSLEYLGKSAIVRGLLEPTVYESNMMRFSVKTAIMLPDVCIALLQAPETKRQILAKAKNAVNQSSINQRDVRSLHLALPAMETQLRFVAKMQRIAELFANASASALSLNTLFSSLQHRAFSGQL